MFLFMSTDHPPPEPPPIPSASDREEDDLLFSITHALLYRGRRRTDDAAEIAAKMLAKRIIEALRASNWQIKRGPIQHENASWPPPPKSSKQ